MKLAIVGSRNFQPLAAVQAVINELSADTVIISGCGGDVDNLAETLAKARGYQFIGFPADWKQHGKMAGPIRNTKIAEECDHMIAFWDGSSRGTKDSINKARKLGKEVLIYLPRDATDLVVHVLREFIKRN